MPSAFAQANRRLAADVSPVRGKVEVMKEVRSYPSTGPWSFGPGTKGSGRVTDVKSRTEDWKTLPWKHIQHNVFRLQQRIYQAERDEIHGKRY